MEELITLVVASLVVAAVSGAVGSRVSEAKGRGRAEGAWFGALLGPFGVLVAVLMPDGDTGPSEDLATEEDEAALRFLGAVPKPPEKRSDFLLERIGDVTLTPEEREQKEREAIRSLRVDVEPPG